MGSSPSTPSTPAPTPIPLPPVGIRPVPIQTLPPRPTSAPSPSPTISASPSFDPNVREDDPICWVRTEGVFLSGLVTSNPPFEPFDEDAAFLFCANDKRCTGVTFRSGFGYQPRVGDELRASPNGETTFQPDPNCFNTNPSDEDPCYARSNGEVAQNLDPEIVFPDFSLALDFCNSHEDCTSVSFLTKIGYILSTTLPETVGRKSTDSVWIKNNECRALATTNTGSCFENTSIFKYQAKQLDCVTQESCIEHCQSECFEVAGVQNGNQCFCGYFGDLLEAHEQAAPLPDSQCNAPCDCNDKENCGGPGSKLQILRFPSKLTSQQSSNLAQPNTGTQIDLTDSKASCSVGTTSIGAPTDFFTCSTIHTRRTGEGICDVAKAYGVSKTDLFLVNADCFPTLDTLEYAPPLSRLRIPSCKFAETRVRNKSQTRHLRAGSAIDNSSKGRSSHDNGRTLETDGSLTCEIIEPATSINTPAQAAAIVSGVTTIFSTIFPQLAAVAGGASIISLFIGNEPAEEPRIRCNGIQIISQVLGFVRNQDDKILTDLKVEKIRDALADAQRVFEPTPTGEILLARALEYTTENRLELDRIRSELESLRDDLQVALVDFVGFGDQIGFLDSLGELKRCETTTKTSPIISSAMFTLTLLQSLILEISRSDCEYRRMKMYQKLALSLFDSDAAPFFGGDTSYEGPPDNTACAGARFVYNFADWEKFTDDLSSFVESLAFMELSDRVRVSMFDFDKPEAARNVECPSELEVLSTSTPLSLEDGRPCVASGSKQTCQFCESVPELTHGIFPWNFRAW